MWRWFDDRSGRWSYYATSNNKTIDDAYRAGQSTVRWGEHSLYTQLIIIIILIFLFINSH